MTEPTNLPDDRLEDALRHELRGSWVPFDEQRAGEMISTATSAEMRRLPRLAAPLTAAAAVLAVGAGLAVFAANGAGDTAAPSGGGAVPSTTTSLDHRGQPNYGTVVCVGYGAAPPRSALTRVGAAPSGSTSGIAVTLPPVRRAERADARDQERAARERARAELSQARSDLRQHHRGALIGSAPASEPVTTEAPTPASSTEPVPTLAPTSEATCSTGGARRVTCHARNPSAVMPRIRFACPSLAPRRVGRLLPVPPSSSPLRVARSSELSASPYCTQAPGGGACTASASSSVAPSSESR